MSSMAAGALFTLIGGSLADAFRRKSFVIAALCVDVCLTLLLAFFGSKDSVLLFYMVSFSSALVGAMSGSALNVWIKDILSSTTDSLSRSLAARGMWNILSKAAGFAMGPLVYSALEFDALFIDAAFSAIPAIALAFALDLKQRRIGGFTWSGGYGEILTPQLLEPRAASYLGTFCTDSNIYRSDSHDFLRHFAQALRRGRNGGFDLLAAGKRGVCCQPFWHDTQTGGCHRQQQPAFVQPAVDGGRIHRPVVCPLAALVRSRVRVVHTVQSGHDQCAANRSL